MRVGISGYVGNRLTGIGRVLICTVQELAKQNPDSTYIIFRNFDFSDYETLRPLPNVKIVDVSYTKESGLKNIIWHQWTFQKLLKQYKCDVAYIPNFTLLLWKVVPTIVTIHDLIEYNVPDKFSKGRMFYRKMICDPLMAKRSDHILTVSQSSYNDIVKYLGVNPSKITLTLNATDKTFFHKYPQNEVESVLSDYGLHYKEYLLFVGTIDYPGKNIKTVVDAFLSLKAKGQLEGKKLVVIGKNGYNSEVIYDVVNRSQYKSDVVFTGYLKDGDLPKFYSGASIMLYLSLFEGFGFDIVPDGKESRHDIIQAITFGKPEGVIAFCRGIQAAAPVDSFVTPEPWAMPGYDADVIMAAGAFVQGSSIELSADGPIKPPYTVFFQGGLTWPHAKCGILTAFQKVVDAGLIRI